MACSKPPACSGSLQETIEIRRQVPVDHGAGGSTITWQTIHMLKASVKQMSSGEQFVHQRLGSPASHKFITRYVADILPSDQIIFRGIPYNIAGQPDNWEYKNRWLTIMATSGVVQ